MTPVPFKFDEIGYWSELKLEIVEKYGSAYTTTFKNTRLKKYYIDGLAAPVFTSQGKRQLRLKAVLHEH